MRTLLIEDTTQFARGIVAGLLADGDIVDHIFDVSALLKYCGANTYDIIIIDLDGPRMNGCDLVKCLRENQIDSPVFVMGGRCDIKDKVDLLDLGADDYLVKPVDLRELKARLRSVKRRASGICASKIRIGNLIVDMISRSVIVLDELVALNPREFRLFELLIARLDQVVTKERLMDQLFGYDDDVGPNALELYVSRIRRKLRSSSLRIETVRCVGYVARVCK